MQAINQARSLTPFQIKIYLSGNRSKMLTIKYPLILLCLLLAFPNLKAQQKDTPQVLEEIVQTEEIAMFFDGIFNHLGITILETGEQLTLHHEGDKITVEKGLDSSAVDFILPLELLNIGDLVKFTDDGTFDEIEATRIAKVFFTPFTTVTLQNEVLSENRKRRAAGIEDLIHVYLIFPDSTIAAAHTLIYVADQWIVIDEIIGQPRRTFTLSQGPALEYQRKIFHAMEVNSRKEWLSFVKWYKNWRKQYSVSH